MAHGPDLSLALVPLALAREEALAFRPLFEGAPDEVPVATLLADGELLAAETLEDLGLTLDEAFTEALEDLENRDAGWVEQAVPVKGGATLRIAVRSGDEAVAAELLLPDVLVSAAELLGTTVLAVAIPSSGALLATDATQKWQLVAAFCAAARMQHAGAADEALWPGVLRVESGRVTGVVDVRTASLDTASKRPED